MPKKRRLSKKQTLSQKRRLSKKRSCKTKSKAQSKKRSADQFLDDLGHVEFHDRQKKKKGESNKSRYEKEFGSDLLGEIDEGDVRELAEGWKGRMNKKGKVFYLHDSGLRIKATSSEIVINEFGEIEPRDMSPINMLAQIYPLDPITNIS